MGASSSFSLLERELWTSWASCLRSYAALHGMGATHHAVVEVSAEDILLRVDARWVRFTHAAMLASDGREAAFRLMDDGTVLVDGVVEEMDLVAEQVARTLLHPA